MSSRRSRSRQSSSTSSSSTMVSSRISEDQIMELVSKLHQLLPEVCLTRHSDKKVSAGNVLQETCNHIRNLHREVDDLSDRISELLATSDGAQAAIIRSLLMQ